MKCHSCDREISDEARFCHYCGEQIAPGQAAYQPLASDPPYAREIDTLEAQPGFFMLPPKFNNLIAGGTAPEKVIWELFKYNTEMRRLLEAVVANWPPGMSSIATQEAKQFLRSHCVVCGERVEPAGDESAPICALCYDL